MDIELDPRLEAEQRKANLNEEKENFKNKIKEEIAKPEEKEVEKEKEEIKEKPKEQKEELDEKKEKRYRDNQSYAHEVSRRIANGKKEIAKLIEDGEIDEDTANLILNALNPSPLKKPEGLVENKVESFVDHAFSMFNEVLDLLNKDVLNQYIDVTDEDRDSIDKRIKAFDTVVLESSEEDRKEILEKLTSIGKSPMQVLKSILRIGSDYLTKYDLEDYFSSGGILKYTSMWKEKYENLQKQLDTANKKLNTYEGNFDKPEKMNLGGSKFGGDGSNQPLDPLQDARRRQERRVVEALKKNPNLF